MPTTRRSFLKTSVIAAGTLTAAGMLPAVAGASRVLPAAGDAFPQGIASGDPKPSSVILWTRVVGGEGQDVPLRLQVATARRFSGESLIVDAWVSALAENDGCVRVKVTGLSPATYLYYRFLAPELGAISPRGRTKTAPAAGAATAVRFALANCQDYIGRYFNAYLPLLAPEHDDLDFLLHVGDFIYETTGDPEFQASEGRAIRFTDEAGAIRLGSEDNPYFAARSLANYRQLHQTYRADPVLRRVLAKFPLIAIWDDHEYSDDRWQTTATYFDGRREEADEERLHNAERAWLEYMPIDDADEDDGAPTDILDTGEGRLWPATRIYRSFRFGQTLDLCLLDYRSFRPDHAIPEDAFPGAIVVGEAALKAKLTELGRDFAAEREAFAPYVDGSQIPAEAKGLLVAAFADEYEAAGYAGPLGFAELATTKLTGPLAIPYLNARLPAAHHLPITETTPRGLSYEMMGKAALFAAFGARYALNGKWFDLYSLFRDLGEEDALGAAQQAFLEQTLTASDAAWSFVASSVSHTTMRLDFVQDFTVAPEFAELKPAAQQLLLALKALLPSTPFGPRVLLNADQWDGLPTRRAALLDLYRAKGNVVLLAGDIHSSWVTDHSAAAGPLFELTGNAVSSATFASLILDQIAALAGGLLPKPLLRGLAGDLTRALNAFLFERQPASAFRADLAQDIRYLNVGDNGIVVVEADAAAVTATYWLLPEQEVRRSYYLIPRRGLSRFKTRRFVIADGSLREG